MERPLENLSSVNPAKKTAVCCLCEQAGWGHGGTEQERKRRAAQTGRQHWHRNKRVATNAFWLEIWKFITLSKVRLSNSLQFKEAKLKKKSFVFRIQTKIFMKGIRSSACDVLHNLSNLFKCYVQAEKHKSPTNSFSVLRELTELEAYRLTIEGLHATRDLNSQLKE